MAAKAARKKRRATKAPSSPIALATSDFVGNTVTLTEESWLHVQGKHGIGDLVQVEKAIRTPMRVRKSNVTYHTNAFAFETLTDSTATHIRAVVHYPEGIDIMAGATIGQVKTAYPVDYTQPSNVGPVIYESSTSTLPLPDKSK